jgi:arabinogalactan oligomer/maltooligosaccharide transport system substrate-binding protein
LERHFMKIRNRGIVAAFATVATAALLSVGVAPVQAATQTVTIWSGAKTAADNPINASLVAFGKKNGINVNIVLKPTGLREAFIAAVPTGKGPDLMIGAHDWTGQLVGAGTVAPVTLGAAAAKFSTGAKAGLSVGGKLYGVPTWTENIALLWNKRDGVDPKGKTFQQLLDSKSGLAIPHDVTKGDPYHFSSIASSFGNTLFTRNNGDWTKTIGYGGAGAAGYANFLATQGKKIIMPADGWDKTACALQSGNYVISGPWMYNHGQDTISGCSSAALTKAQIGVAVIPSLGGSPVHQFSGVYGVWKSVKVAGKANALAVGKVLNYIASADAQLGFYKAGNVIPANTDALAKVSDAGLKGFGVAGQGAYAMPSYVFMDTVWDKIGRAEAALISGNYTGSATAFLQKAVAAAQSLIDGK